MWCNSGRVVIFFHDSSSCFFLVSTMILTIGLIRRLFCFSILSFSKSNGQYSFNDVAHSKGILRKNFHLERLIRNFIC